MSSHLRNASSSLPGAILVMDAHSMSLSEIHSGCVQGNCASLRERPMQRAGAEHQTPGQCSAVGFLPSGL